MLCMLASPCLPSNKLMSVCWNPASRNVTATRARLQDVVQFGPMGRTLFGQVLADPGFVPQIFKHIGIPPMLDWVRHFSALGTYTLLDKVGEQQPCKLCIQAMPAVHCIDSIAPLPVHASGHSAVHAWPMAGLGQQSGLWRGFDGARHLLCKPSGLLTYAAEVQAGMTTCCHRLPKKPPQACNSGRVWAGVHAGLSAHFSKATSIVCKN